MLKKEKARKAKRKELKKGNACRYTDTIAELNLMSRSEIKPKMKRIIISKYFAEMFNSIYSGEQWNFPDNFGSIAVIKETETIDKNIIKGFGFHNAYTFDEMNNAYAIKMASTTLLHLNYAYMPYPQMMARLDAVLKSEHKPVYRTQFT